MKKYMLNYVAIVCMIAMGSASGVTLAACDNAKNQTVAEQCLEQNTPTDGMFFTSANVVEEYEYDDAYCLLYNDPDANLFDVEICVDLETYAMVGKAISKNRELIGSLVVNRDQSYDGLQVYTFVEEPEFEMAEASSKVKSI